MCYFRAYGQYYQSRFLPYSPVLLHLWDWSCGFCVFLSLDTPDTQAADHRDKTAWVCRHGDYRVLLSDLSPVKMSHTGFLMQGWLVADPLMTFSCRLDILWIRWFPSTAADRLYRSCDYMTEQLGPWRCQCTQDRINPPLTSKPFSKSKYKSSASLLM